MSIWYPLYHPSSLEPGKLLATEPPECVYIYYIMYVWIYIYTYIQCINIYIYTIYIIHTIYNHLGYEKYRIWNSWGRFNPLLSAKFRPKWFCPRPFVAPQKVSASFSHLGPWWPSGMWTGKWRENDGKVMGKWENDRKMGIKKSFSQLFSSHFSYHPIEKSWKIP